MLEDPLSKQCKQILRRNGLNPIEKLGKGGFGTVHLVSKIDFTTYDTELYSVKCTNKKNFLKKPVLRRYLKQEINLMSALNHPNIVRLHRTFEDDGWIFMVMEYCNMGNLGSFLSQKTNKVCSLGEAKKVILEVLEGLEHMHERKMIHRDIKPENILLTKNQTTGEIVTKICDLGFSRQIHEEADTVCGTTYYMAPEIFDKKKYGESVDLWALGVLFFLMLFGVVPFKSVNMAGEIHNKCHNGFDLESIKIKPNDSIGELELEVLKDLFRGLFRMEPSERISISEFRYILNKELSISKGKSQRETLQSDVSEEDLTPFYIQKVQFVQAVQKQVCQEGFLKEVQKLALKYYLDKVCLCILAENNHSQVQCKYLSFGLVEKLRKSQEIDSITLASKIQQIGFKQIGIKKFEEVFSLRPTHNFQQFKEAYRIVVGHAFYRAHKSIQDYQLKCQIKLKLFCCHVINRVFEEHHNYELFRPYYKWQKECKNLSRLNLAVFKEWVEKEESGRLLECVEAINNKFYKKK